jgi:stearoyl-CoA desaturase (delta-9 desaturase)
MSVLPLLSRINWVHTTMFVVTTSLAAYGIWNVPLHMSTLKLAVLFYFWTGMGITGGMTCPGQEVKSSVLNVWTKTGYHRYWSHRAFEATKPLQVFLLLGGTAAIEGSCLWWSKRHRAHHRYTDTDKVCCSVGAQLDLFSLTTCLL